jgi:hypothetical protein
MNKIKFVANVARWFDRVNGNTYHSVNITNVETGETIYCPMTYGYGEHYKQSGLEIMEKSGLIPEKYRGRHENGSPKYYAFERENDYPIMWNVSDGLKRDCVKNGTK